MKNRNVTLKHKGKENSFLIRSCSTKDFSMIIDLQNLVWENIPSKELFVYTDAEDIMESLEKDLCIGVFHDTKMVAFSLMIKNRISSRNYGHYFDYSSDRLQKCVSFDTTFVDPGFRGYGIQRLLTSIRIEEAVRSGAIEALVTVSPDNLHSLHNLYSAGFEIVDHKIIYDDKDRYILRKQLEAFSSSERKEAVILQRISGSYLEIDLDIIRSNSSKVVEECAKHKINILGVTKGFSAIPSIVHAMIEGGITRLADARLDNIIALRQVGFKEDFTLLRIPMISNSQKIVRYTDCSLNSEISTIQALSDSAVFQKKKHSVILMIDLGDRREGILPADTVNIVQQILELPGIHLKGIGTNMGCYGGVLPTQENLSNLVETAEKIEHYYNYTLEEISGGGTSSLTPMYNGQLPNRINQLRIGEGILLGTDATHNTLIPWLKQDAFLLYAEIIEIKEKPSLPEGIIGKDAFGNTPQFEDLGIRKRAIIALGRQDVPPKGIIPCNPQITILGASSDHTILDITDASEKYRIGEKIPFKLNYQGLLHLCNSKYIKKIYKHKYC